MWGERVCHLFHFEQQDNKNILFVNYFSFILYKIYLYKYLIPKLSNFEIYIHIANLIS